MENKSPHDQPVSDPTARKNSLGDLQSNTRLTDEMTSFAPQIIEQTQEAQETLSMFKTIKEGTLTNLEQSDGVLRQLLEALATVRRVKRDLKAEILGERKQKMIELEATMEWKKGEMRRLMDEHVRVDSEMKKVEAKLSLLERNIQIFKPLPSDHVTASFSGTSEEDKTTPIQKDDIALTLAASPSFFAFFAGLSHPSPLLHQAALPKGSSGGGSPTRLPRSDHKQEGVGGERAAHRSLVLGSFLPSLVSSPGADSMGPSGAARSPRADVIKLPKLIL